MDEKPTPRITLAVIYDRQERMMQDVAETRKTIVALSRDCVASAELRKAVTHQLWDSAGNSRIQGLEGAVGSWKWALRTIIAALAAALAYAVRLFVASMWGGPGAKTS